MAKCSFFYKRIPKPKHTKKKKHKQKKPEKVKKPSSRLVSPPIFCFFILVIMNPSYRDPPSPPYLISQYRTTCVCYYHSEDCPVAFGVVKEKKTRHFGIYRKRKKQTKTLLFINLCVYGSTYSLSSNTNSRFLV